MTIDESHHIHAKGQLTTIVDKYASTSSQTRLILLSDVSQSGEIEMAQSFGTKALRLCEVSEGGVCVSLVVGETFINT